LVKTLSDETKNRISKAKKGKPKPKLSGKNNHKAKKYTIIDPNCKEYIVHGELVKFCKHHNLSVSLMYSYVNIGIIDNLNKNTKNELSHNCIGWRIDKIEENM